MPTITIKVTADEKAGVETAARIAGQNISEYVREAVQLRQDHPDLSTTIAKLIERSNNAIVVGSMVDDLWKRMRELEQLAGIPGD